MDLFTSTNLVEAMVKDPPEPPWIILLVDDDEQMHQITKLALAGFQFKGRGLKLLTANSGAEAKSKMESRNDIALALIDVVMESEHAGLELVKYIRKELKNHMTRLVLRTGQAGQAPEDIVVREYDIDDYKEKTELTKQKLRTLLYSMLRSYSQMCVIKEQKKGLNNVIIASAHVQNADTFKTYATEVLNQLTSLLCNTSSAFLCVVPKDHECSEASVLTLAATGDYATIDSAVSFSSLPVHVTKRCRQAINIHQSQQYPDAYVYCHSSKGTLTVLLYIELHTALSPLDKQLLKIYTTNIALTFDKLNLMKDLQDTSKELVFSLANALEARNKETGAHAQRVAKCSELLASYYGLSDLEVLRIKYASPLHDIGKVAISDLVLNKSGELNAKEWEEMQRHVEYGVDILGQSKSPLIKVAAEIAGTHHEKWDGSGYPNHLKEENIPISGRITGLADVFDTLGSKRSYKEPWSSEQVRDEIVCQKGKHFDPKLVEILLEHWDEFILLRQKYPD
ncbi:DUF3369 domain-containing protein [Vibrio sp. HN007]|uniref:DUF3369 domain-containing protein n=1 Tax=Vibrio iocasae TaxID=3098914 RepID=UPI0035D4523B